MMYCNPSLAQCLHNRGNLCMKWTCFRWIRIYGVGSAFTEGLQQKPNSYTLAEHTSLIVIFCICSPSCYSDSVNHIPYKWAGRRSKVTSSSTNIVAPDGSHQCVNGPQHENTDHMLMQGVSGVHVKAEDAVLFRTFLHISQSSLSVISHKNSPASSDRSSSLLLVPTPWVDQSQLICILSVPTQNRSFSSGK